LQYEIFISFAQRWSAAHFEWWKQANEDRIRHLVGIAAMIIGMPVYDLVDMLDVTGPFEMFDWAGFEVDLLAEQPGMKWFRNKTFAFEVTRSFADARIYDAIWVPGGDPNALAAIIDDPCRTYLDFLVAQALRTPMVCSVCEGAMLLAAAGLLDSYHATTHWAFTPCFAERFPNVRSQRDIPASCSIATA
jgi:putative intracellular protease/amidase